MTLKILFPCRDRADQRSLATPCPRTAVKAVPTVRLKPPDSFEKGRDAPVRGYGPWRFLK